MKRPIARTIAAACCVLVAASVLVVGGFVWTIVSRPTMDDYIDTHLSAKTRLPIAVEMEKLFPGQTDHFITHYGFNVGSSEEPTNLWNSEAHFGGRYCLTMQVDVFVDYQNNTITPAGKPTFYLEEVTSFDGNLARYGGVHKVFGEDEWRKIYDSGGDFSVLGVTVQDDAPVQNFDQYVRAVRESGIPISLLNDR